MTDNNQPFNPPLTAEERALWDQYMVPQFTDNWTFQWAVQVADDTIRERRRRFGVPTGSQRGKGGLEELHEGKIDCALCGEKLKPDHYVINRPQQGGLRHFDCQSPECGGPVLGEKPPTVPVEIDILRAEIERVKEERDELREELGAFKEAIENAHSGYADGSYPFATDRPRDHLTGLRELIEENVSLEGCAMRSERDEERARAEKAEKERDEAKREADAIQAASLQAAFDRDDAVARANRLEIAAGLSDGLGRDLVAALQRAEKAEADLAAVQPVLDAVVDNFDKPYEKWNGEPFLTLQAYADDQRAKRAGGAQ